MRICRFCKRNHAICLNIAWDCMHFKPRKKNDISCCSPSWARAKENGEIIYGANKKITKKSMYLPQAKDGNFHRFTNEIYVINIRIKLDKHEEYLSQQLWLKKRGNKRFFCPVSHHDSCTRWVFPVFFISKWLFGHIFHLYTIKNIYFDHEKW